MTTTAAAADDMVAVAMELASSVGMAQVAETLGLDQSGLEAALSGDRAWPRYAERALRELSAVVGVAPTAPAPAPVQADGVGDDWRDSDAVRAADLAARARAATGVSHGESVAQKAKAEIYRYIEVIVRRQFDVRLSEEEALSLLAYRLELELLIIMYYKDTVPVPGMNWDGVRRLQEADERSGRLKMVLDQQRRAERFFSKVRRWSGRNGADQRLVQSIVSEAAVMEAPLESDADVDRIMGRSEFGRFLQRAAG